MSCPVCEGTASEYVVLHGEYRIVRCGACATAYADPMPAADVAAQVYSGDYDQDRAEYRRGRLADFRRKLGAINRRMPDRGLLTDVGCADGEFLQAARTSGWKIAGVEPGVQRGAAETRLGVAIAPSLAALEGDRAGVVTLWEVIEHVAQPVAFLGQLRERLLPGGILALSTPNGGFWQAVWSPSTWAAYTPPEHIVYFTPSSLALALRRAGFARVEVRRRRPSPPVPDAALARTRELRAAIAGGHPTRQQVWLWRMVRLGSWPWARLAHRDYDVYTQLEALATRSASE